MNNVGPLCFLLAAFCVVGTHRISRTSALWRSTRRIRVAGLALLTSVTALVIVSLALIDLDVLEFSLLSTLETYAIYLALGILFGFALLRWFDQRDNAAMNLQWGAACLVILLIGLFFKDVRLKFQGASSLSTPLISFTLAPTSPRSEVASYDTKGIDSLHFATTDFTAGIDGFQRVALLAKHDSTSLPQLVDTFWKKPITIDEYQDQRNFSEIAYQVAELKLVAERTTDIAYNCLKPYARIFPDGLPLQEELAEVGASISIYRPTKQQLVGYAGKELTHNRNAQAEYQKLEERARDLLVNAFTNEWIKMMLHEISRSPVFSAQSGNRCEEIDVRRVRELLHNVRNEDIPYKVMLASSTMLAAGYPMSSAVVLARWLDGNQVILDQLVERAPGSRELFVRRLFQVRAMHELDFVLEHTKKYAPRVEILGALNRQYRDLLRMVLDFDHHELAGRSCEELKRKDMRSFVFGGLVVTAKYLSVRAGELGQYDGEAVQQADRLMNVEYRCFRSVVKHLEIYLVEFFIAAAKAKAGYAGQLKPTTTADALEQVRHLEEARRLLQMALLISGTSSAASPVTKSKTYEDLILRPENDPAEAMKLLDLVTNHLQAVEASR